MVKLRTTETYKFGQKNIIPVAGMVEISDEGVIEVADEHAQGVVDAEIGFEIVSEEVETTTTTTTLNPEIKPQTEGDNLGGTANGKNDIGNPERDEMIASLQGKTLAELQELAKPFKPVLEWKKLDQAGLVNFLASKLV